MRSWQAAEASEHRDETADSVPRVDTTAIHFEPSACSVWHGDNVDSRTVETPNSDADDLQRNQHDHDM